MPTTDIPSIPLPLILWLEKTYPIKSPSVTDQDREIWIEVGRQDLIRKLRHFYTQQIESSKK